MVAADEPLHYNNSSTLYRMQFILGPHVPKGFGEWQQARVGDRLHLTTHPDLHVEQIANDSVNVTLIGYLLDPRVPNSSDTDILTSLLASLEQGGDVFEFVYPLGGRWVLLISNHEGVRLLNDAAGLRQVFYSDLKQTGEMWCASQPNHIAHLLGLEMDPEAIHFIEYFQEQSSESWWPGDSSPYKKINRLLPNHYLDLATGAVRRFWPQGSLPNLSLKQATSAIGTTLTGMMRSAANRFDLAIAMSAGWDSRLMLAACRPVAKDLSYYTVKRPDMAWEHMDVHIPTRLLHKLGLPHDIIEHCTQVSPDFAESFNNNVPFAHSARLLPLQTELNYYKRQKTGVTGNVSEVARCYYRRPADPAQSVTVEHLMTVTGMNHLFAEKHFRSWLDATSVPQGYNPLDLFYWEQRIGSWFAHNCLEFDSTWQDIFVPFNNRQMLADMLAVDENLRQGPEYLLYRHIMELLWPEILSEPINPTRSTKNNGLRKYLNSITRRLHHLFGKH